MRLRVLGCHGGESPSHRATCFLIDDGLLLDAGSMTRGLSVQEQLKIDHVFLSHPHLDHVRDLGLLADNIFAQRKSPVEVYGSSVTIDTLAKSYFNNLLWPDFTKIPNPADPNGNGMLRVNVVEPGQTVELDGYRIKLVPVDHSIDCLAAFVTDGNGGTLVYSGDTGPTDKLFDELNRVEDLRGFIFEVSFPNEMAELAKVSGHLTPEMMYAELEKFSPKNDDVPIFIYGMKPGYLDKLQAEIGALDDDRLRILSLMDEFEL